MHNQTNHLMFILFFILIGTCLGFHDPDFKSCKEQYYQLPEYLTNNYTELCKNYYFGVLYDYNKLSPKFVFNLLTYENMLKLKGGRKQFENDPELKWQTNVNDPIFSITINRGHINPSYAMSWDTSQDSGWWNTYYMSNIAPQYATLNQYCWKNLEAKVINYILNNKVDLYVITLTSFEKSNLPKYFMKVLLIKGTNQCVGFYGNNWNKITNECLDQNDIQEIENKYGGKIIDCIYEPKTWEKF